MYKPPNKKTVIVVLFVREYYTIKKYKLKLSFLKDYESLLNLVFLLTVGLVKTALNSLSDTSSF